jgi:UDP-glucose 4-epimerase
MSRRILITGGFGYIGGRVANYLARRVDLELVLGSRSPGRPADFLPALSTAVTNFSSAESLDAACAGVDTVIHLAAMNENDCVVDPVGALVANGVGTARLVAAACRAGVRRLVYLSTAHVYGSALSGRVTEDTLPRARHPYATSHQAAEDCVLAAHDAGRMTGIVLRLSNGFGAPPHRDVNRWTLIVNDLCRQAAERRELVLRSAGLEVRDFITLHDSARAVAHCLDLANAAVGDGLFNIGGESSLRIVDLAEEIRSRCQVVLGFLPPLTRPAAGAGENGVTLDYRMDKFKGTGFALAGSRAEEIDETLRRCQGWFGKPQ